MGWLTVRPCRFGLFADVGKVVVMVQSVLARGPSVVAIVYGLSPAKVPAGFGSVGVPVPRGTSVTTSASPGEEHETLTVMAPHRSPAITPAGAAGVTLFGFGSPGSASDCVQRSTLRVRVPLRELPV